MDASFEVPTKHFSTTAIKWDMRSDFYQQVRLATCLVRTAYGGAAIIIAVILGCSFLSPANCKLLFCEMRVHRSVVCF